MKTYLLAIPFIYFVSCNNSEASKSKLKSKQDFIENSIQKTETPVTVISEKNIEETILNKPVEKETITYPVKKESEIIAVPKKETISVVKNNTTSTKKQSESTKIESEFIAKKNIVKETIEEIKESVIVKANHTTWDELTKTYVSGSGKVNYKGFKSKLSVIESYLKQLQNTPPIKGWSRNEKLAYWFNLYNAATIHLVASNYPVKSIKDINGGKPWDKKFIKTGTNTYSLNDIENTLIRPNYNEPRLHVAFNCAAVSCPSLLNAAFTPTNLNSQLNSLSKKWITDVSKNEITANKIEISQIFNWYKGDFKEGIIPFINKYSTVKANSNAEIIYKKYNWNLNE